MAKPNEKAKYDQPKIDCSNLILLAGPAYGDKAYLASFLLSAVSLKEWAIDHSKSVWSTANLEQQARGYLPIWLDDTNNTNDGYVTMIDMPMRQVLVPYTYDFYLKGWLSIYCHQCKRFYDTLIDNAHSHQKVGNTSNWTEEWLCPSSHVIHFKEEEIRWIVRKSKME
jgi:hypothetical protein